MSHSSSTSLHRQEVVNRAARYIAENLGEPLTLDDMSRAAGMSKFHLHRVFEEHVGTTLGRYLGAARLKAALLLLSAPETRALSVLEIALQVGFENASAFSRGFYRHYGVTPSAVRQGHQPRDFPLLPRSRARSGLDRGVTVVSLPAIWAYGYEVSGMEHKSFVKQAPEGFKLARDTARRHGIEGVAGDLGLPNYSWVLRDDACRLLCGFRSSARLDVAHLERRAMRSGKWLRARHEGPHATRWQTWQRLQLLQLRWGRPRDGREPFEEVVVEDYRRPEQTSCDVYFPC